MHPPQNNPRPARLKVVIAGGSGSLGRALAADLGGRGHDVVILTRTPAERPERVREVGWDARTVGPWARELQDPERPVAVINLAGQLVDCRPTARNITVLRESRVAPPRRWSRPAPRCDRGSRTGSRRRPPRSTATPVSS